MKITAKLRSFLVEKNWLAANASDDDTNKAVGAKLVSGELTPDQLAELSRDETQQSKASAYIAAEVAKALTPMNEILASLKEMKATQAATPPPVAQTPDVADLVKRAVADELGRAVQSGHGGMEALLSKSADVLQRPQIRVKEAVESYSHNRTRAIYPERCGISGNGTKHLLAGKPASHGGVDLDLPSERDKAISSAYFKWSLTKSNAPHEIPRALKMTDHDKDLLNWSLRNSKWTGYVNSNPGDDHDAHSPGEIQVSRRKLNDYEVKALLDDSTSGGIEIAPIEFDDALVTIPVLYGELFPLINVVNVNRGRRMKGGALANPTWAASTEGTAITAFTTTSFVTAFDTTIFVAAAAMEIGQDFEEDSPTTVGSTIIQKYGEKAMEWYDRVIAVGDGTTEPEGIFTSSAPVLNNSTMGTGGPPTVADYEGLMFGVSKAYRMAKGGRTAFFANEVSYRRARAIPVGPGDERRVFGMSHSSYTLLDNPYKIQTSIPNSKIGFANFAFYRGYRRLGVNFRIITEGVTLGLKNTKMIVARLRFGGHLELGGAACILVDGQS